MNQHLDPARVEALAQFDALPEDLRAMTHFLWGIREGDQPIRPTTDDEIRGALRFGMLDPVHAMKSFAGLRQLPDIEDSAP